MWNDSPYNYSLNEAVKKIISNLPSQYRFSSNNGGGRSKNDKEWWSRIVVKKEEGGSLLRTFEMVFVFSFPSFPFYYKPSVLVKVRELYESRYTIFKEVTIKLSNLKEDSTYAEKQSATSITWSIHKESCEKNAQYVFDNIKIVYSLLDSILSIKLPSSKL